MQQQAYTPDTGARSSGTISSDDVNGTEVYSPAGESLGHIDHLVIDKTSGVISYAVMGFGGFLGLGEDHHPIPWKKLSYDTRLGGYVTDITKDQLQGAPARSANWRDDRDYVTSSYKYYGVPPYWI